MDLDFGEIVLVVFVDEASINLVTKFSQLSIDLLWLVHNEDYVNDRPLWMSNS